MYSILNRHIDISQQVIMRQLPPRLTLGREFGAEGEVEWNQTEDVENQVLF